MAYRLIAIPALLALVGGQPCALAPQAPPEKASPKFTTEKVANQTWFDLANCWDVPPRTPPRASDGVLRGLLESSYPRIMECMANPKNRGPADKTVINVSTKVGASGVPEHEIGGDNLTDAGEKCVRTAIEKVMPDKFNQRSGDVVLAAAPASGEKKVEVVDVGQKGKSKKVGGGGGGAFDKEELRALKDLPPGTAAALVKFIHDDKQPMVKMGINDVSDAAAHIRLAVPKMCSCFEPWKQADPAQVSLLTYISKPAEKAAEGANATAGGATSPSSDPGSVRGNATYDGSGFSHIKKGGGGAAAGAEGGGEGPATVVPTQVESKVPKIDSMLSQVASCMAGKIGKMKFKTPDRDIQVPYNFFFINSASGKPLGSGEGWAKYEQVEAIARRRSAEATIAAGARTTAQTLYNALVVKFQKNAYAVPIDVLIDKCKDLVRADEAWASTLQKAVDAEKQKKSVVASLAKKDASNWGAADKLSAMAVETAAKDHATARTTRRNDEAACPRVKEQKP